MPMIVYQHRAMTPIRPRFVPAAPETHDAESERFWRKGTIQ
jgi:hypothetical protein